MPVTIDDLPNEVIQQILHHLPALSVPTFQQVCRRFNRLADSLNWRYLCQIHFDYWNPTRCIEEKFASSVDEVDWKTLFVDRHCIDRDTTELLDSILSCQTGRIEKFQKIIEAGYDAKDCLLRHLAVHDEAEDVLARRYYADAVLGCLHRVMAIKEWSKITNMQGIPLERALIAFDMFVLHERTGDFAETAARFDRIAESILSENPKFADKTTRSKAITIAQYLLENHLIGVDEGQNDGYHDLQNNFIGIALHDTSHPSLPLVSAAIYCCVARRLHVDASVCCFIFHDYVIIKPPQGFNLDGISVSSNDSPEPMYMDPFQSIQEIPVESLISRIRLVGAYQSNWSARLDSSSVVEIIMRMSRNILTSVQESHRRAIARHGGHEHILLVSSFPDLEGAFYSALWASLLAGVPPNVDGLVGPPRRRNYLTPFIEHFETHFPIDVGLIEDYIVPLFYNSAEFAQLRESVRVMRSVDSLPKQTKRRTKDISQHVRYRVGQVFTHKRYDYQAVITGWDVECGANEHWMAQMRVHELSRGRHQSFYHVLVEDKSVRYVAEENIEIIKPDIPHSLMGLAGRHFKRWDKETKCFISNIRDEYPDN